MTSQEQEEAKAKMLARRESERAKKKEKKEKRQKNGAHEKEEKKEKKQKHEDKVPSSTALFLSSLSIYHSMIEIYVTLARNLVSALSVRAGSVAGQLGGCEARAVRGDGHVALDGGSLR